MSTASYMRPLFTFVVALAIGFACHEDDGENAGRPCDAPDQCYPDVDPADIVGEVVCLDRVPYGYCTHECQTDADCCAVEGECETGFPQVCSPFESDGRMMCFLSCEDADLGGADAESYCQDHADPAFACRSSGGGSANRKVCVP